MESKEYIAYKCLTCGKTTILLLSEVSESQDKGKYVTCGHDGRHAKLREIGRYDDLKECMSERSYKRGKHGAIKETR